MTTGALVRAGLALSRATVRLQAEGDRDPADTWEHYARPSLWSSWAPQIHSVECAGDRIVPGLRGRVHAPVPQPVPVRFYVTEVDEDARTWSWTVRVGAGPVATQVDLVHGVEPTARGSRTWLVLTGPRPLVAAYAPLARFAMGRLVSA